MIAASQMLCQESQLRPQRGRELHDCKFTEQEAEKPLMIMYFSKRWAYDTYKALAQTQRFIAGQPQSSN